MQIVHFSTTALAGSPSRLVSILEHYTAHQVRLVDLKRYDFEHEYGYFDYDVVFSEQPDKAVQLAEAADVIHLHNDIDLDSTTFAPIDFRALKERGKLFVRQFHTTPEIIAARMDVPVERVTNCEIPSLVIAQYPERFYPKARVVPNILPHNDYLPLTEEDGEPDTDLVFSPMMMTGAWEARWSTKGAPETLAMMNRASELTDCSLRLLHNMPLPEVLERKRRARIVIDDLVNGSFHLSGLEGLCLGKPVLSYLDSRTDFVLREISGSASSPFLNVRLEDALEVLVYLIENRAQCEALGGSARAWMETYWRDDLLAGHYTHVYNRLAQDPGLISRQRALSVDTPATTFTSRTLPDLIYTSRRNRLAERLP